MMVMGCDYHLGILQIAFVDIESGDCGERQLQRCEKAEKFYQGRAGRQIRVGMEAGGHAR